jgi:peptidyl-prolyl cis-trans isomerase B (cyclophilin B)
MSLLAATRSQIRYQFALTSALFLAASCIDVRDPNTAGPHDNDNLAVTAQADPATTFEGGTADLVANVEGGNEPLTFRWDQNGGPAVTLENSTSAQARAGTFVDPGRYVFRVTVTDADGIRGSDFAAVEVLAAVTVDSPPFAIVGAPVTLAAQLASDVAIATFHWEVIDGTATFEDATAASTTLTATRGETVKVRLTVNFAGDDQPAATRDFDIVAVPDFTPRVRVETNLGDFVIELDGENTPRHMVNFLRYVDEGFYEGLLFHRNACIENQDTGECEPFVLQGGGFRRVGDDLVAVDPTHEAIAPENETSASNGELYTVALALRGGSSGSGAVQFFINLDEENEFLDEEGFTVFGKVVEGVDVVDAMAATDRVPSTIIPGEESLPAEDIVIEQVVRID